MPPLWGSLSPQVPPEQLELQEPLPVEPSESLLSVLLLPVELAFWIGFSLPVGPLLGIARVAVSLAGGRGT